MPILQEMVEAIHALGKGARVEQVHKESAPGQFEIVLGHLPALEAADQLLLAKQAIVAVSQRHGLRASFLPKMTADQAGTGCHMHLSMWSSGGGGAQASLSTCSLPQAALRKVLSLDALLDLLDGGAQVFHPRFEHFLAGIFAHVPGLMCFTTPTPNSFRRVASRSAWAGGFVIWGFGNKEAALCIPQAAPSQGLFTNVEFKVMDGTANPHVALAAVIGAGLVGVQHAFRLQEPTQCDPAAIAPRTNPGPRQLPSTFAEAKAQLMQDRMDRLRALLGRDFVRCHLAVREAEWAKLSPLSLDEEVEMLRERY